MKNKEKKILCKYDPRLQNDDNDNKKDVKEESYCLPKSINDEGALVMMCERNEKPQPSAVAR
jgi:ribosomal protein S17E